MEMVLEKEEVRDLDAEGARQWEGGGEGWAVEPNG